jgi:hypothetical protein
MKKKINIAFYIVGGIILFVGLILGAGILILNLTDCDPGEKPTSYPQYIEITNNELGVAELHYNGIVYRPFGSFTTNEQIDKYVGDQIGVRDTSEDFKIYTINGYNSDEWIVNYLDVIMGGNIIYKAVEVTEIPADLEQFKEE